jgi:DNA polymerase I
MEFQVLDVDYVMVDGKPVVRVFGKDTEGKSVCATHRGFLPYFYATGDGIEEALSGNPFVVKLETVERTLPMGYQKKRKVYKITLKDPGKTVEVRNGLIGMGATTYEADILFKYRWMNDLGVGGMKWVRPKQSTILNTSRVSTQRNIELSDFDVIEKYEDAPLRYASFDIETVSLVDGSVPDAEKDPVAMISFVFEPEYRGIKSVILSTKAGNGVEAHTNEKGMLERFTEIISDYDPDVLTGFNIVGYDLPYILKRMEKNSLRASFGRCREKRVRDDLFAGRHRVNITGRIVADSFSMIRKGWNMKRYGLDFVSKELLGEEKKNVKKSEIGKFWRGGKDQFRMLTEYCLQDSALAMKLLLRLNLMDKYVALSKISGSLVNDILEGGETQRIEIYFLREFNREGYIIPTKVNGMKQEAGEEEEVEEQDLKGGFVIEPKRGLHNMVLVMDFKSMYPSLIRTYNICPTTLLVGESDADSIQTPTGSRFVKKEVRHGIVPRILENLMSERDKVKKDMKKADGKIRKALDMKQLALKVMANAFYGYFGYQRAKIYSVEIASAVTALGRETIHRTVKAMEEDFGYEVVYGDTDSVMIKVPTDDLAEAERIVKEVAAKMTEVLPGVMELDFEKIFKRFLPLTKKRYMGWSMERGNDGEWTEGIVMKGIETVRRDWCELTGETMKTVIEIVLKRNDVKEAVNYFKTVAEDLFRGKVNIEKLVITKTITKRVESYDGLQPHVEVIKKMRKRGEHEIPGVGDRIGYVIVKGSELLSKRAEDPAYVKERGLSIDPRYYIDNQLLPPLERIFTAMGVSRDELVRIGRQQMGLLDAINGHSGAMEAVSIADVKGFSCVTCGRDYRRPPLSGACDCGGALLFSTSAGLAKVVFSASQRNAAS